MPSRRYFEVQNNYYIILAQKYLSFQPREVFSRGGGRGRWGRHHCSWWLLGQQDHWGDCEEWVAMKYDLSWKHLVWIIAKQIFQIIPGGAKFALENSGYETCAASYQGGFVMMGGGWRGHGKVDRWEINNNDIITHFCFRYDSEGNYIDSLPDLLEARRQHACVTFTSSSGEEVWFQDLYHFLIFPQGLLVAGGAYYGRFSSTELYLPSKKQWTRGGDLPRHFIKMLSIIIIILMMIKSSSPRCWWFYLHMRLRTAFLFWSADLFGRFLFAFASCIL